MNQTFSLCACSKFKLFKLCIQGFCWCFVPNHHPPTYVYGSQCLHSQHPTGVPVIVLCSHDSCSHYSTRTYTCVSVHGPILTKDFDSFHCILIDISLLICLHFNCFCSDSPLAPHLKQPHYFKVLSSRNVGCVLTTWQPEM